MSDGKNTDIADLAAATRRLVQLVRTIDPDSDADSAPFGGLAARVDAVADLLEPHVLPGPYMQVSLFGGQMFAIDREHFVPADHFPYSPVVGALNPVSAPFEMHVQADGTVAGSGVFPPQWNGPPDGAHGGAVAMVLDELLGAVMVANSSGGFTGTLSVRYENLTRLDEPSILEGRVDGQEGRKLFLSGEVSQGGLVTARANAIFILIPGADS